MMPAEITVRKDDPSAIFEAFHSKAFRWKAVVDEEEIEGKT